MGWIVRGSNLVGSEIKAHLASCTMCIGSFMGVQEPMCGAGQPPRSSTEVVNVLEVYVSLHSVCCWFLCQIWLTVCTSSVIYRESAFENRSSGYTASSGNLLPKFGTTYQYYLQHSNPEGGADKLSWKVGNSSKSTIQYNSKKNNNKQEKPRKIKKNEKQTL